MNLVEVVSGGVFCTMSAPPPHHTLKFGAASAPGYHSYTVEERAQHARTWLQACQEAITSFFFDSTNRLSCLPLEICAFRNLRAFTLKNQEGLTFLPHSFGLLRNLQLLDITDCGLVALPSSIKNLQGLVRLRLSRNMLASFPDFGPASPGSKRRMSP